MDVQIFLEREITKAGGLRELARATGVDASYLSRVAAGKQEPGREFLDNFGLEKVVSYRKKNSIHTR